MVLILSTHRRDEGLSEPCPVRDSNPELWPGRAKRNTTRPPDLIWTINLIYLKQKFLLAQVQKFNKYNKFDERAALQ